jgi:hypothetical protein
MRAARVPAIVPAEREPIDATALDAMVRAHPADDLLAVLARSAKVNAWAAAVAVRLLERGARLTEGERRRLREMRDEQGARAESSTLQPMGPWRPRRSRT